ncbi:MAG: hypothetical protein QMD22_05950 [archaeon]|nr:hypothetical protein [archaeon]
MVLSAVSQKNFTSAKLRLRHIWVLFYPPVILDYHKVLVYLKASQIGGVEEWSIATCDRRGLRYIVLSDVPLL